MYSYVSRSLASIFESANLILWTIVKVLGDERLVDFSQVEQAIPTMANYSPAGRAFGSRTRSGELMISRPSLTT
jgi:hypothetical protein